MTIWRRALQLGICCCVALTVAAENLPIRIYTPADGLAHARIKRIVRDSRGFLWLCTGDGLSRFDGYRFINYDAADGLPFSTANDLLETRDGVYWVATFGGVCRFDPFAKSRAGSAPQGSFTAYSLSAQSEANRVI